MLVLVRRNKVLLRIQTYCLLCFLSFSSLALADWRDKKAPPFISKAEATAISERFLKDKPRLFLYSRKFAERFGLEPESSVELDERLFAVKWEIVATDGWSIDGTFSHIFRCKLSVYLDSQLDIHYPIKPFGHARELNGTGHTIRKDLPNLSKAQFNELYRHSFANRARIAQDGWQYDKNNERGGGAGGLYYTRILTDAFEGVTYIEFLPNPCPQYEPSTNGNWNLWFQKAKEGDYFDLLHQYHEDWPKFMAAYEIIPIPKQIMEQSDSKRANEYNRYFYHTRHRRANRFKNKE